MTFDEYQLAAARTINRKLNRMEMLRHGVYGLTAEAGEVAGLYQKELQGHAVETQALIKALGDVMWMVSEICEVNGIKLSTVAETNIKKLLARYPSGFSAEKSLHRQQGDI